MKFVKVFSLESFSLYGTDTTILRLVTLKQWRFSADNLTVSVNLPTIIIQTEQLQM